MNEDPNAGAGKPGTGYIRQTEYELMEAARYNAVQARHHAERIIRLAGRNPTAAGFSYLVHNANRILAQAAIDGENNVTAISIEPERYREIAQDLEQDLARLREEEPSREQAVLNRLMEKTLMNCRGVVRLQEMTRKPPWTPGREAVRTTDYLRAADPELWEDC